jgi:23S rRNA (cytidine1920-2'-O)/16S rRNA (cytidine1409-2'-O)-methyltransferase
MGKVRLDILVQERAGVSRSKAQGLIHTGRVRNEDGEPLKKPGQSIDQGTVLVIDEGPRYVSRGGEKLEGAMTGFALDVAGLVAIDVGASTGGFTDCLLQHGASKVYALDVGYGQLDWKLRQDERVVVMERTNIRKVVKGDLDDEPEFFTVDCSFISLRLVLPPLQALLAKGAKGVALIKPQFEAGKDQVGKGGVVRDSAVHDEVIGVVTAFAEGLGFAALGVLPSPLLGPAGNREFLLYLDSNG